MIKRTALILSCASALMLQSASAAPSILVTDAWSRPATGAAVMYAKIVNGDARPDRLVGGSSPDAGHVELHESSSSPMAMGSMNGMPMKGAMMSMKLLDAIGIPAHGTQTLAPGGYHIMLVDLKGDFKAGQTIPVRLHFAHAGWVSVALRVRKI